MENKINGLMFSVAVITYNQEKYIAQTLDSIINQRHNYSYEIVVGDDCSSDGTREIVRQYAEKYPEIVKPIFNEKNLGIIKNYFNVISHCSGKYIMECAGDDFWLPGKVELQIPFMESNLDVGMCYTYAKTFDENNKKNCKKIGVKREEFEDILYKGNPVPAVTVCFKNSLIQSYCTEIVPLDKNWLMEDYPIWLYISKVSKAKFLNEETCAYRVLNDSASHSDNAEKLVAFAKSTWDIQNFFSKKYLKKEFESFNECYVRALFYVSGKNRKLAKKEFLQSGKSDLKTRIYIAICSSEILFALFGIYRML